VIGYRQFEEDGITMDTFNIRVIHPISNKEYPFGPQRPALYAEDKDDFRDSNAEIQYPSETGILPVSKDTRISDMDKEFIDGLRNRRNFGLFISVADYSDPGINDLDFPNQDAENLYKSLSLKYSFHPENSKLLKDPTREEIIEAFDNLTEIVNPTDQVLIFYAGHGLWDEKLQQGFWLPRDAKKDSKAQWLSNSTIRDYIRGINSKHTLLIADACFSGGIFKSRDVFNTSSKAAIELYKLPSRKAITSGTMTTVPDQSVFMRYLIKRLNENNEVILTSGGLFNAIRDAVINNSALGQVPQFGEIRESGDEGGDFIFIVE
jgi:hypothetical protein